MRQIDINMVDCRIGCGIVGIAAYSRYLRAAYGIVVGSIVESLFSRFYLDDIRLI